MITARRRGRRPDGSLTRVPRLVGAAALAAASLFKRGRGRSLSVAHRYLDALPVAVFVLDEAGHPLYANVLAERMLGKGIQPQVTKDALSKVYPSFVAGTSQPYPPDEMPIVRALAGEDGAFVENVELDRDGKRIPIEARANPVRDESGRIVGSIAVFQDISDRKVAEAARVKQIEQEAELRQARAYEALRSRFVNSAAHELFTPLTPLRINAALLGKLVSERGTRADQSAYQTMLGNLDRLQELVEQTVRVAQIEADQIRIVSEPANLVDIVQDQVNLMRRRAEAKKQRFALDAGNAVTVLADPGRLGAAIQGVLANAVKFSPPSATIHVRVARVGATAHVEVQDPGVGITAEDVPRVFDPFWQGAPAQDLTDAGWGLGLYISQAIAHAHRGRIVVSSDGPGKGSTFRFELPVATAASA